MQVTSELYASILSVWLEKPSVNHVAEFLDLPKSLVKRVAEHGVPSLGLVPLPRQHKRNGRKPVVRIKSKLHADTDMPLAARAVIAKQEAEQHVTSVKTRLRLLRTDTSAAGAYADSREVSQKLDGTLAAIEEARLRAEYEEQRIANVEQRAIVADNVSRSANEAAAARMTLQHCMTIGAIYGHLADRMLEMIESGQLDMPAALTPRMIVTLAGALDKLTSATERAVKLEKGRGGEPDQIVGVQVGVLLDSCTPEELDVVAETGCLPTRLKMLSGG